MHLHIPVCASTHKLDTTPQACPCLCHRANEVYEFAYTYPYPYSQLQRWLLSWQRLRLPYLQRQVLCRTVHMRKVDVLLIQDTSNHVGRSVLALPMALQYSSNFGGGTGRRV